MKVWITRAEPGASRTAERVRALGHEPVVAPLLEVRALPAAIDLEGVGALAFTSANGVRAFAALSDARALPVFAVGEAPAAAARAAGFADVASADGDVQALAALIARARPAGAVLASLAAEPAGDLIGALQAADVTVQGVAVYETVFTDMDAPPAADAVLIHSPKAARRLASLLGRGATAPQMLCCISQAAAEPLTASGPAIPARPDEPSLLALLPPRDPRPLCKPPPPR